MNFGIAVGISNDDEDKERVWLYLRCGAGAGLSPASARMVATQLLLVADLLEKSNEGTEEE